MSALRHVAPAGAPIGVADLARWAATAGGDVRAQLCAEIGRRSGVPHVSLASTGRAALTLLLRALHRLQPNRRDVVVPSYTCFSVAASVVKAGLRPRVVDIAPETLDYDREALERADLSQTLAIVATNLYGLPNDLPWLSGVARGRGVFLVDDAAQALGASIGGRASGSWGDAGLYSFDKGKNVAAIEGGVMLTGSEAVAQALAEECRTLAPAAGGATGVVKALAYAALLRPSLYWIPNGLPGLGLGATVYTTDFPLAHPTRPLTALALTMLRRLDEFAGARRANAARLLDGLAGVAGVRTIAPQSHAVPAYPRLPILLRDETARDRTLARLTAAGFGATGSYPASLADVPALRGHLAEASPAAAGGRHVARHIVTLPTHPFVSRADIAGMLRTLAGEPAAARLAAITSSPS